MVTFKNKEIELRQNEQRKEKVCVGWCFFEKLFMTGIYAERGLHSVGFFLKESNVFIQVWRKPEKTPNSYADDCGMGLNKAPLTYQL